MIPCALLAIGLFGYPVRGVVEDPAGRGLAWASVVVAGIQIGTSTGENGAFSIELPDSIEAGTLVVSHIGYTETQIGFSNEDHSVRVVLRPENIRMSGVEVAGDYSISQTERIGAKTTLDQMDVYTTPGASADLFHALKALPAFSGEADIASIAIRGGSPREVLVALNGLPLRHPFLYDNSTGGLFSVVDENSLHNIEAFAGPLPPAFGGSMSGGVLLGTRSGFDPQLAIGASMAHFNLSATHPLIGGVWFARSYYNILAEKLSLADGAAIFPSCWTLQWLRPARLGGFQVTPLVLLARSHTELDLSDLGFESLRDDEENVIAAAAAGWMSEDWTVETVLGHAAYRSDFALDPVLEKHRDEKNYYSKASVTYYTSPASALMVGAETCGDRVRAHGLYQSGGALDSFALQFECRQSAAFAAHRFAAGRVSAIYGVRPVRQARRFVSLDPRGLTEITLSETARLRLSAGRMTQYRSFDDTLFAYADHFTLGMEQRSHIGRFNLDVFYKRYKTGANAYGLEGLVRFAAAGMTSWIGLGLMRGKNADGTALDHDVPAKLLAVFNLPLNEWAFGLNCQWSAGRPYTPLAGTYDSAGVILPVWGEANSARLPNLFRVNCRLSRLFRLAHYPVFFYVEGYNVTDHDNVTSYCYSIDYAERKGIIFFPRMVYLGIVISL